MGTPTVSVRAADPLLGEVVTHVLVRNGVHVVEGELAALELHVHAAVLEVCSGPAILAFLPRSFWEHELLAALGMPPAGPPHRVPPSEIAPETLHLVLLACFSPADLARIGGGVDGDLPGAARVRETAARIRTDEGVAARVVRALDGAGAGSIDLASAHLHAALGARDLPRAGQLLWEAARTPGAAWRRFEERARLALVVHALLRASGVHAEPMAAK